MAGRRRMRLDALLVERGLFPTRARAQAAILAGLVRVDGRPARKAGEAVDPEARVEVLADPVPYASRGGIKLAHALDRFGVDPAGRVAIDVGASTGGFTDVLLRRGARRVFAVDVGYGQLAWPLRQDPRVVVMERTNVRRLTPADLPEPPDLAAVDVSFISLRLVLPVLRALLRDPAEVVALVKPQFEAGPERVGKGGIVRDPGVHHQVLRDVAAAARDLGWGVGGACASPIRGADGNREFFLWLRLGEGLEGDALAEALDAAVDEAWRQGDDR